MGFYKISIIHQS